jgi:hypothetical protein
MSHTIITLIILPIRILRSGSSRLVNGYTAGGARFGALALLNMFEHYHFGAWRAIRLAWTFAGHNGTPTTVFSPSAISRHSRSILHRAQEAVLSITRLQRPDTASPSSTIAYLIFLNLHFTAASRKARKVTRFQHTNAASVRLVAHWPESGLPVGLSSLVREVGIHTKPRHRAAGADAACIIPGRRGCQRNWPPDGWFLDIKPFNIAVLLANTPMAMILQSCVLNFLV